MQKLHVRFLARDRRFPPKSPLTELAFLVVFLEPSVSSKLFLPTRLDTDQHGMSVFPPFFSLLHSFLIDLTQQQLILPPLPLPLL